MAELLTSLRDHLIAEGVVRDPRVAGAEPPLWREPRLGVPAPGEYPPNSKNDDEVGPDAVLGAFNADDVPPAPYNAGRRIDLVDVRIRTKTAPSAHELEEQLRAALIDRRNWSMAGLTIIECLAHRGLQPLGSDEQSYDWVCSYAFERYSGLP